MSDLLIPKGIKPGRIKAKRASHPAHLILVRQMPCIVCMEDRSDSHRAAHHLLRGVVRGMGRKAADNEVIPLCAACHSEVHLDGNELDYLASHGIVNTVAIAAKLYAATGSYEAMLGVITAARETSVSNSDTEAEPKAGKD